MSVPHVSRQAVIKNPTPYLGSLPPQEAAALLADPPNSEASSEPGSGPGPGPRAKVPDPDLASDWAPAPALKVKRGHAWTGKRFDIIFRDGVLDRVWGSLDQKT